MCRECCLDTTKSSGDARSLEYKLTWGGDGPEDLAVTTSGKVTIQGLDEWVQTVLADARYKPNLRVLIDHRNAQWDHLTVGEVRERVDLLTRDEKRIGHHRVAWLVGRSVDFGIGRMMEAFSDGKLQIATCIFRDVEAARAWLLEPDV